jgi:hypothetical protein
MGRIRPSTTWTIPAVFAAVSLISETLSADDLSIERDGVAIQLQGEVLGTAQDESFLFRSADGKLWIVQAEEVRAKTIVDEEVPPLEAKEFAKRLLEDLPDDFRIYEVGDFVIAYNTERAYAKWVGGLYQRLQRGFTKYWSRKKFELTKPGFPLAIIIFASRGEYDRYIARELGEIPISMVAYYNLQTNRVAMYDLTSGNRNAGASLDNDRRISEVLSDPRSIPMVATIIHEGVHQLMFNSGMQSRFSDTPLWINEGLAMYFETPDLSSTTGWRAIGRVNSIRLSRFRKVLATEPISLEEMLTDEDIFRSDQENVLDAYAQAWAFNYFLLNRYPKEYVNYLKFMSKKPLLIYDDSETRLRDFKTYLGEDLDQLQREFVRYIENLN